MLSSLGDMGQGTFLTPPTCFWSLDDNNVLSDTIPEEFGMQFLFLLCHAMFYFYIVKIV